jgi:hypothetical protein
MMGIKFISEGENEERDKIFGSIKKIYAPDE